MRVKISVLFYLVTLCVSDFAAASQSAIIDYSKSVHSEIGKNGMVVSQEALATQVGHSILSQGGNAVDAAVAVGYALSVTLPRAGNLGGGGFMMVHLAKENKTIALDYREMAPQKAFTDMYLNQSGDVDKQLSRYSHLSAGVPGTVAGLDYALEKWGTMSRKKVMEPAINMALTGIKVNSVLADSMARRAERLFKNKASKKKFSKSEGKTYQMGDVWRQPDLAKTLYQIQKNGAAAFYQGEISTLIVDEMERNNGLITKEDLANYRVVERSPVVANAFGYQFASMPPPSSGGIHLLQMLKVLEKLQIQKLPVGSAQYYSAIAESAKYAYADRSKYLGDPDFVNIPQLELLEGSYLKKIAMKIKANGVTPSSEINPGVIPGYESPDTTHFSVMDRWGNAVANTYTLNFSFGSGITVSGAGFLLNNEMDDFSAKPGRPNAYGLIGGKANKIEPGKRPLSSMTPTIVFKKGRPFIVTGSPGGSTIITVVLQTVLNTTAYQMDLASATMMPRMHHQWLPDVLQMEPSTSPDTLQLLRQKGYEISTRRVLGSTQSIMWDGETFYGFADLRRPGAKALGL